MPVATPRVNTSVDPLNRTTAYGYDGAGNLATAADPAGRVTSIGHDIANQVSTPTTPTAT